jgi:DNA-directed RNA polymerase specialized sigma subunit
MLERHRSTEDALMYTAKGQLERNALIRQYQPLVRKLAHHMMAKLPANVQVDDSDSGGA